MQDATKRIADKVRGVAAEHHLTQQGLAILLGIDRKTVHERWHGRVAFTAPELLLLAEKLDVGVDRFFPERASERAA